MAPAAGLPGPRVLLAALCHPVHTIAFLVVQEKLTKRQISYFQVYKQGIGCIPSVVRPSPLLNCRAFPSPQKETLPPSPGECAARCVRGFTCHAHQWSPTAAVLCALPVCARLARVCKARPCQTSVHAWLLLPWRDRWHSCLFPSVMDAGVVPTLGGREQGSLAHAWAGLVGIPFSGLEAHTYT